MPSPAEVINIKRYQIKIEGIVQGVGFRPTVYRYALEHNLSGFVLNTITGVTIEAEGSDSDLQSFVRKLKGSPPSAATITSFSVNSVKCLETEKGFEIRISRGGDAGKSAGISPDIATCPDCIKDIRDAANRRFGYPFTNCTNCGPRFTIIKDRPYDRKYTSMAGFTLCPLCRQEYNAPLDRRFHAQPNACPLCGPRLTLTPKGAGNSEPLDTSRKRLKAGELGAIKGLGGYHFSCDPFSISAVKQLRKVKKRPYRAFALMMKDLGVVEKYCCLSPAERECLQSPEAPIVLLRKKDSLLDHVSPDNNYLGVMLPHSPLHHLLMDNIPVLIMTSANRRDEPLAIKDEEAHALMADGFVDFVLSHNREIVHRCDDSIVQFAKGRMQFIRRARGYVPRSLTLSTDIEIPSLSLGSNMKNTFALRRGRKVFLSQHIGDLTDYTNILFQEEQIKEFSSLLDISPEQIICDAHPGFAEHNKEGVKVYHHHAHMLSVMAEHDLSRSSVLGVICDGTGLGRDGKIWGFEFLQSNGGDFERVAHLDYFLLPGGEKSIEEIDRIAIGLVPGERELPFQRERIETIRNLIKSGINCPQTSSMGRLFDGVAALLGLCNIREYEARGAILLQKEAELYEGSSTETYPLEILYDPDSMRIDYRPLILGILDDLERGKESGEIAWKFHEWLVHAILQILLIRRPEHIVLSGGCFQNRLLTEMVINKLDEYDFQYYLNESVPPNDGGLSLGQAYYQKGETTCV